MTKTPARPTRAAAHRLMPTFSRSTSAAMAVTTTGARKPMAVALATGMAPNATMNSEVETTAARARPAWTPGRVVLSTPRPRSSSGAVMITKTR